MTMEAPLNPNLARLEAQLEVIDKVAKATDSARTKAYSPQAREALAQLSAEFKFLQLALRQQFEKEKDIVK